MSAGARSPNRSFGRPHRNGHVPMYLGLLAAASRAPAGYEDLQLACEFHESNGMPVWRPAGSWAGPKRLPREATQPRQASTPPRVELRASTAPGHREARAALVEHRVSRRT